MSKGLCQMPEKDRDQAIQRRIRKNTGGLGYLSAKDAVSKRINKAKKEV